MPLPRIYPQPRSAGQFRPTGQHRSIGWTAAITMGTIAIVVSSVGSLYAGDLKFKKHAINDQTDYSAAALIDVNHDGQIDVVCGGDWYEGPHWTKHFVAKIARIGGRPDGFSHLEFDVNRDGWSDVITVNYRSRSIKWMEHPGQQAGPWTMHTVAEPGPMETGRLVDIDGDGQLDLLPNGRNFAAWWEFRWKSETEKNEPAWVRHDLPNEAEGHGAGFGDIDGDGRGDIVGQNGWLKAPTDARAGKWLWHPEFKIERGSIPMLVVDPDEDGDNDIVWCSAHGFGVYWLEQTKNADGTRKWHRHAIDTSWSQGHAPLWADLDGDGQKELIAGKRYMSHGGSDPGAYDPLVVYRYQFNRTLRTWDRWTVSYDDQFGLGLDPKTGDIDNDGDLDLMASGRSGLYWLENIGAGTTSSNDSESGVDGRQDLLNRRDLLTTTDSRGRTKRIDNPERWGSRRTRIVTAIGRAHGRMPSSRARVRLNVAITSQETGDEYTIQRVLYSVDARRQASALLYVPKNSKRGATSGVVCMFEPKRHDAASQMASDLASRGYVCIVPKLLVAKNWQPVIGNTWQAMRAADVLQATPEVHGERLGFVGDAMSGKLGLYVAALDQRFVTTVADASQLANEPVESNGQYSLAELVAAVAPRSLRISLPREADIAIPWKAQIQNAKSVFALRKASKNLVVVDALETDREQAIAWLRKEI